MSLLLLFGGSGVAAPEDETPPVIVATGGSGGGLFPAARFVPVVIHAGHVRMLAPLPRMRARGRVVPVSSGAIEMLALPPGMTVEAWRQFVSEAQIAIAAGVPVWDIIAEGTDPYALARVEDAVFLAMLMRNRES